MEMVKQFLALKGRNRDIALTGLTGGVIQSVGLYPTLLITRLSALD